LKTTNTPRKEERERGKWSGYEIIKKRNNKTIKNIKDEKQFK